MKTVGVPFRLIAERLNSGGECLVLLPNGFVNVLLDSTERFKWPSTWIDDEGNRIELTDIQHDTIELGIARLCNCMDIINNITVECGGCSGGGGSFEFTINGGGCIPITPNEVLTSDDISDVNEDVQQPLNPEDPLPDTLVNAGHSSWNDYDVYWCDLSHHIHGLLVDGLRYLHTQIDKLLTLSGAAALIAYLTPAGWGAAVGTVAFSELMTAIVELLSLETLVDELLDLADELELPATKQAIICAIFDNRYNIPAAKSAFIQEVTEAVTGLLWAQETQDAVLKLIDAWLPLRYMLHGLVEVIFAPMVTGQDCTACANAPENYDYSVDWDFANNSSPWSGNAGVEGHYTPFYSDGHMALKGAAGDAVVTLDADGLLAQFPGKTSADLVIKKVVIFATKAEDGHANFPWEGTLKVDLYDNGVSTGQQTYPASGMVTDVYQSLTFTGDLAISATGTDLVIRLAGTSGGAFNSECKIGHVTIYLNDVI